MQWHSYLAKVHFTLTAKNIYNLVKHYETKTQNDKLLFVDCFCTSRKQVGIGNQTWKIGGVLTFLNEGRFNPVIGFHMERTIENFAKHSHPRMVMKGDDRRSRKAEYTYLCRDIKYTHKHNYHSKGFENNQPKPMTSFSQSKILLLVILTQTSPNNGFCHPITQLAPRMEASKCNHFLRN